MRGTRHERWFRTRGLLVLVLIPALLLGAAFDGAVTWIHSHGLGGGHVHLLSGEHEVAALDEWHAADHRHGHEHEPEHQDEPHDDHRGVVVDLPEFVAVSARGLRKFPWDGVLAPAPVFRRWTLMPRAALPPPQAPRSDGPPWPCRRTGVAALLRSSHAILI